MNRKRMAVLTGLAIALAVAPVTVVVPSVKAKATQIREPITFTIPAGQCPDLPVAVDGTGDSFSVIDERIDKNGVDHVEIDNIVTGTATDSDGATYGFNYHNHTSLDIPAGGFPFQASVTDHFNLNGKGKANHMHVGFVVRVTFTSPADPGTFEFVNERGNSFFCDPI